MTTGGERGKKEQSQRKRSVCPVRKAHRHDEASGKQTGIIGVLLLKTRPHGSMLSRLGH